MAPDITTKWMQLHRNVFGDRPLSELCLPLSHDAGACRRGYSTTFGTEDNVLTQTRSIFDQLELGVRHLDIRPTLTNPRPGDGTGNWATGHFTDAGKIGVQGANCMEIFEVVEEINRFTQKNAELIVVELKNIWRVFIDNTISSTKREANDEEWKSLFDTLAGIKNLFTFKQAGGASKQKPLEDYLLNQFIGNGEAAVVVLVGKYGDQSSAHREHVFERGFWPTKTEGNKTSLDLDEKTKIRCLTYMQSDLDAIYSTLNPSQVFGPKFNSASVLSLARKYQDDNMPWILQELVSDWSKARGILMDKIENLDLLTLCLAISYQRYNQSKQIHEPVIVYGGQIITSPETHKIVRKAIDDGKAFTVINDNLHIDPWSGMKKSCAIFYEQDGIVKARFAHEGQRLQFDEDVISIKYGDKQIRNQVAYLNVLKAIHKRDTLFVHNDNLGGDPQPGVRKTCVVRYRNINGKSVEVAKAEEYNALRFESLLERIGNTGSGGMFM